MKVLAYIARHGKTSDSDKNIFRGDRNSRLNKQGFLDAGELQDFFKNTKFGTIYSSDLTRAIQTGHMIGEPHGKVPHVTRALRPWDIGEITGKDKNEYGPIMQHYIDNRDEKIPGGESRDEFERERIMPLIVEACAMGMDGNPPIIIGHSSIIHAALHLLDGEGHKEIAVKPGGIMVIYLTDGGELDMKPIFKQGKEDSSYNVGGKKQHPSS